MSKQIYPYLSAIRTLVWIPDYINCHKKFYLYFSVSYWFFDKQEPDCIQIYSSRMFLISISNAPNLDIFLYLYAFNIGYHLISILNFLCILSIFSLIHYPYCKQNVHQSRMYIFSKIFWKIIIMLLPNVIYCITFHKICHFTYWNCGFCFYPIMYMVFISFHIFFLWYYVFGISHRKIALYHLKLFPIKIIFFCTYRQM